MKITNFSTDLNSQKQIRDKAMISTGEEVKPEKTDETVSVEANEETQEKPQKSRKTKRVSSEKV